MIEFIKIIGLSLSYFIMSSLSAYFNLFSKMGTGLILVYVLSLSLFFEFRPSPYRKKYKTSFYIFVSVLVAYLFSMSFDIFYRGNSFHHRVNLTLKLTILKNVYYNLFLVAVIIPLYEEFFFRSILLSFYTKKKFIVGVLFISVLFSLSHFAFYSEVIDFYKMINLFLLGLLLSFIRIAVNLFFAFLIHSLYNAFIFLEKYEIIDLFFLDYLPNGVYFIFGYSSVLFLLFGLCYLLYWDIFNIDSNELSDSRYLKR